MCGAIFCLSILQENVIMIFLQVQGNSSRDAKVKQGMKEECDDEEDKTEQATRENDDQATERI